MSILIKGMKMPKDGECVVITSDGTAYKYESGDVVMFGNCYIGMATSIELPSHGDLVDRDEIRANFFDKFRGEDVAYVNMAHIDKLTPVIPADPEKEETT